VIINATRSLDETTWLTLWQMKYPGYLLNPGDMFSVDPDMVMFATGSKKGDDRAATNTHDQSQEEAAADTVDGETAKGNKEADAGREVEEDPVFDEMWEDEPEEDVEVKMNDKSTEEEFKARRKEFMTLRDVVKETATKTKGLKSSRLQELRSLYKTMRNTNFKKIPKQKMDDVKAEFAAIMAKIASPPTGFASQKASAPAPAPVEEEDPLVLDKLREMRKNPHYAALRAWPNNRDKLKPYATPWKPRDYMSAFAFIPRYLEVNQNVCSAVYLRDPVARPGLAEVPSPFHTETSQLAFQWYLRRR
jgi:ribosomal protein S4